ncbi:MAG: hypothetical protein JO171_08550 [Paludibacterium sp.]|uniref:hypothetical protein n=1 Tax=Paludibacterium sp. TaxID=1917523 RepID=UPI0025D3C2FC|nr:hypothetical protein [Paludibacterium sp.]MBV8047187.1 hypothetical protein [Paludibacterium sp.]MBV8647728.1 hypothetical protein [Paludibacterium sp.]
MMRTLYISACSLGAVSLLLGCSSTDPTQSVATSWGQELRQMQVEPVFPIREDIQPGDVFILCAGSDPTHPSKQVLPISTYWTRLDATTIKQLLEDYYRTRLIMPINKVVGGQAASQPSIQQNTSASGTFTHLQLVAFPDAMHASLDSRSLSALIPAGVALGRFGISSQEVDSGSLSITSASYYGLPQAKIMPLVKEQIGPNGELGREDFKKALDAKEAECQPLNLYAQAVVVSEVFLANGIRLKLQSSKAATAQMQLNTVLSSGSTVANTLSTIQKLQASAATAGKTQAPAGNGGTASGQDAQTQALSAAVVSLLTGMESSQENLPGVSGTITTGSTGTISMDSIFTKPLVFGYRGVHIRKNASDTGFEIRGTDLGVAPAMMVRIPQ